MLSFVSSCGLTGIDGFAVEVEVNLSNGMVEMFVQGEDADIDAFLAEVQKGDRFIRVDNLSVKPTAVVEGETKFRYHYY